MSYYYEKQSDEGTNSPFVARMFLGIIELRDLIVITNNDPRNNQVAQERFNQLYEPMRSSLEIALEASRSLDKICFELKNDGHNGKLVNTYPGGGFEMINTKGPLIRKEFSSVVHHSSIAIKNHLPKLVEEIFNIEIGCLFQNDKLFEKALLALNSTRFYQLIPYLQTVRPWTNQLINDIWNQSKHSDWKLDSPKLTLRTSPIVDVNLPMVFATLVNIYAFQIINRCCLLIEDLIVYGFNFQRLSPIFIAEINRGERRLHQNRRFQAFPRFQDMVVPGPAFIDDFEIT